MCNTGEPTSNQQMHTQEFYRDSSNTKKLRNNNMISQHFPVIISESIHFAEEMLENERVLELSKILVFKTQILKVARWLKRN